MKILCLAIVIANLALFFWEYRMGTLAQPNAPVVADQEIILLAGEEPTNKAGRVNRGN